MNTSEVRITRPRGRHLKDREASQPARYLVRGVLPFPIDMLRYDSAWPASEVDSNKIAMTIRNDHEGALDVVVYSRRFLTEGRWKSFGWSVIGCIDE